MSTVLTYPTSLSQNLIANYHNEHHLSKIFSDVDGEFCCEEIVVRLIHFWEARNFKRGNSLIGFKLLFIDVKSETMQGFVSVSRFFRYEHVLKDNNVYRLNKFMLTPAKTLYKVSSNARSVSFTDQTTLSVEVE
ncbi:unnamed protein product [Cochlearia groenlandica]